MYSSGVDFVGVMVFVIIIALCCALGDDNKSTNTATKRTSTTKRKTYNQSKTYHTSSISECPCCGEEYEDECEECGYSDVNQGWVGENY